MGVLARIKAYSEKRGKRKQDEKNGFRVVSQGKCLPEYVDDAWIQSDVEITVTQEPPNDKIWRPGPVEDSVPYG